MTNPYYDHTTYPAPNAPGSSAALRAEFDKVEQGFEKLPTLAGQGGKAVAVKADGSGLEAVSALSVNTTGTAAGLSGGTAFRIPYQVSPNVTGFIVAPTGLPAYLSWNGTAYQWTESPGASGYVTLAGAETLTNKTLGSGTVFQGSALALIQATALCF
jgi:hypothetical protein